MSASSFSFSHTIACTIPTCAYETEACLGTLRLRISHSGDQLGHWSDTSVHFTLFRSDLRPMLTAVEPELIPGIGTFADLRSSHVLSLHGSNFAPTGPVSGLRCRFGASGAQVTASFVHKALVRCASPFVPPNHTDAEADGLIEIGDDPPSVGTILLSLTVNGDAPEPMWAEPPLNLTFYDGSAPPQVDSFDPIQAQSMLPVEISIYGSNFAPMQVMEEDHPDTTHSHHHRRCHHHHRHRCHQRRLLHPRRLRAAASASAFPMFFLESPSSLLISPLSSCTCPCCVYVCVCVCVCASPPMHRPFSQAGSGYPDAQLACSYRGEAVAATWVSDTMLRCSLNPSPLGSFEVISVLSHSLEGASVSRMTIFDPGALPIVTRIDPPFGSVEADTAFAYTLHGANFAPTGELRCRFGFGDGVGDVMAEYISPMAILCARPAFAAAIDVPVVASIDGGAHFSSTAARFTFRNESMPPTVSSYSPRFGSALGGTLLHVKGTNFAPHPELHCTIGGVYARATFDSATLIQCATPPSDSPVGSSDANLTVHVAPGYLGSAVALAAFTYHMPLEEPTVSRVDPPFGSVSGGEVIRVHGSNFAPTGAGSLLCQFGLRVPSAASFETHSTVRPPARARARVGLGMRSLAMP